MWAIRVLKIPGSTSNFHTRENTTLNPKGIEFLGCDVKNIWPTNFSLWVGNPNFRSIDSRMEQDDGSAVYGVRNV